MNTNQCEIPDYNPPGVEVAEMISKGRTIAVVGLSDHPSRDSYRVSAYLFRPRELTMPLSKASKIAICPSSSWRTSRCLDV
ncbi:MAG: hypothetical protein WCW53_06460 [Syntrophales bacterium]|jgi:hypothetical protein|nr:hypothetical protein [Syntrophales bacterium]